ncbi:MAG TPA: hypothetical protein VK856_12155 [Anaerolineaceae bacterium]|nr:hypothetical protein [Anaerolineaceae bacterium]
MKRNTRRLFAIMLAIPIIISSCGQGAIDPEVAENTTNSPALDNSIDKDNGSQTNENNSAQPETEKSVGQQGVTISTFDASTIEINLDENSLAIETIGPEGGSFSTIDANGVEYTLIIPAGALIYDEEITMTPIANIEGEVISEVFQAGVKLEPEGLRFFELVSIEIISNDIEEGAVGFTTQSGGENFHLIPSSSEDGALTITTTHFTEFGVSQEMINDINQLGELVGEVGEIWLEQQLAMGDAEEKLAALERMIRLLMNRGASGINLNNWEPWTVEVISLILRINQIATENNWNENTPGFIDLMTEIQNLVDLWFQQIEGVVEEIREKCIQGEVAYVLEVSNIMEVGSWLINGLTLGESRTDQLEGWRETLITCFNWELVWQANVLTTGSGLRSDISLGAERNIGEDYIGASITATTNLEVEYIEGFFKDICDPKDGKIYLEIRLNTSTTNLGISSDLTTIEGMEAIVKISEDVFIDCGQGFSKQDADAQRPFHGGALEQLNSARKDVHGYWVYELEYNPGGGVIAQFEEGPLTYNWSEGQAKLWQLVTLYQATTTD